MRMEYLNKCNFHAVELMATESKRYFEETFQKEKLISGQWEYRFRHTRIDHDGMTHIHMGAIGKFLPSEVEEGEIPEEDEQTIFQTLPDTCHTDGMIQRIYEQFAKECGKWFKKCPTLDAFRNGLQQVVDGDATIASLRPNEEDYDWQLLWVPTVIRMIGSNFTIGWAPCYKLKQHKQSRLIPDQEEVDDSLIPELQGPELSPSIQEGNTRLIHTNPSTTVRTDWLQEIPESMLPYSDIPALRLDEEFLAQREKYRRRVREARIRAKLARYRAERIAQRFEERFGVYPDEDEEEAQTEAEQTEDEL
jgi:hypothetical protein